MDREALTNYLERTCARVCHFLNNCTTELRDTLRDAVLDSPNPQTTAGRLDDLLGLEAADAVAGVLADPELISPFLTTVGGSRFLFSTLVREPDLVARLFVDRGCTRRKSREEKEQELNLLISKIERPSDFDRNLRRYRDGEYLRIGCRDLSGMAEIEEVMAELSDLAGACLQAAIDFHRERLVTRHGAPPDVDKQAGFAVIGMGKVSGRELNFSSDVDVIYVRGPEEGRTPGPESVPIARFFEALASSVTRSLSHPTEDGFVFRVDLRLRPEGDKGELVPSLTNAVDYYLGWGRTWERAALMKAAPLAGDRRLAEQFVEEVEPFVYRKYLDYSTLDEMRLMKLRIEAQLKRKPGVNLKLGQGGIREIEFFVQALQLINAGRIRRVRTPSTLEALDRLRLTGLLEERIAVDLREAYRFFRKTEHRIQINHQMQTHELPRTAQEQEELARRMGYREDALASFLKDLERHRHVVEEVFSGLFYQAPEEGRHEIAPEVRAVIDTIHDESASRALLGDLGFVNPSSYRLLAELINPSEKESAAAKSRHLLERLLPLMLEELLAAPDPDETLVSLVGYIESLQGSSGYFSTFLENPATVRFLMKILGESRFFTDLLIRHPQSIDSLIGRGRAGIPQERAELGKELSERLSNCESYEAELDVLRRFKNEEMLKIGIHHLSGELESTAARWLFSELAEACLTGAVELASREMARRFGTDARGDELPFVILGMGKLGGMEMTYLSDLDVIFIYDVPEGTIGRLSTHDWFSRLASRIISILSVPTAEGTVFAIDTRLRPSGNKGPLVSSLRSFQEYHRTTSQIWEKQALIRARTVTGPERLSAEVSLIVHECIMRTELSEEDIAEMARLRQRMQREIALEDHQHVDLKTGHGGLVDVEFLVQGNVLKHARRCPDIISPNTLDALAALKQCGLLDASAFAVLDSGYRFLSNLEDRLRIMEHRSVDRMPLQGEKLRALAGRMGYGRDGGEALLETYFRVTSAIRTIYDGFFNVPQTDQRT